MNVNDIFFDKFKSFGIISFWNIDFNVSKTNKLFNCGIPDYRRTFGSGSAEIKNGY